VTREEAEAYAKEAGGLLFFEASAKTGKGVQELFTEIGESHRRELEGMNWFPLLLSSAAKNLPIESMTPKTPGAGAAGSAGNRRAAAAQSGNGGPGNKVNLNDGAANKARGGCC
jgi:Ras-related protein Rab-5C